MSWSVLLRGIQCGSRRRVGKMSWRKFLGWPVFIIGMLLALFVIFLLFTNQAEFRWKQIGLVLLCVYVGQKWIKGEIADGAD